MEYVAYKPQTHPWFMRFINHNLHVKRRGDFGTFCSFSSRFARAKPKLRAVNLSFARAKPKPKVPHLFLPKSGVRPVAYLGWGHGGHIRHIPPLRPCKRKNGRSSKKVQNLKHLRLRCLSAQQAFNFNNFFFSIVNFFV